MDLHWPDSNEKLPTEHISSIIWMERGKSGGGRKKSGSGSGTFEEALPALCLSAMDVNLAKTSDCIAYSFSLAWMARTFFSGSTQKVTMDLAPCCMSAIDANPMPLTIAFSPSETRESHSRLPPSKRRNEGRWKDTKFSHSSAYQWLNCSICSEEHVEMRC